MSSSPFIWFFAQKSNNFNDLPDWMFPTLWLQFQVLKCTCRRGRNSLRGCETFLACYSASQSLLKYINTKSTKLYLVSLYFQTLHKILVPQHIYGTEMRRITTRIGLAHCSVLANWTTSLFHLSRGPLFHYRGKSVLEEFLWAQLKDMWKPVVDFEPSALGHPLFQSLLSKRKVWWTSANNN